MLNKLAKRQILLMLLLIVAGHGIYAQQQKVKYTVNPDNPNIIVRYSGLTTDQDEDFRPIFMNNSSVASVINENEDLVTVTTLFDCDEEHFEPFFCQYTFFDENKQSRSIFGYEGNSIKLPKGKYDIVATYPSSRIYYVIREQVNITSDTTISTNPEEAQVHIKFQPSYPNGEICRPQTRLTHEDNSYEVIDDGNCGSNFHILSLVEKESGKILTSAGGRWGNILTGYQENDGTESSDIFVNYFSDRYAFTCSMLISPQPQDGNYYLVNFQTETCKDSVISNNDYDYVSIDVPFKQSPVGKENGETLKANVQCFTYDAEGPFLGVQLGTDYSYELLDGESCRYSVCNAFNTEPWAYSTIQPLALDGVSPSSSALALRTLDQRAFFDKGKLRFLNNGISGAMNTYKFYLRPNESHPWGWSYFPVATYPWNPILSYECDKRKTITGNSCPILVPLVHGYYNAETGNIEKSIDFSCHLGRNGETRERDSYLIQSIVEVDGESLFHDDEQNVTYFEWTKNADSHGVVDITVTNDDVDVDGLPGKNVTTIHFDMANEDQTAPMLQMLDFRDTEDNAIDRFATAEEGKLQFYCGDFNDQYLYISSYDYYRQFFVCNDLASVEVAYSPYQADTWTELDASEVAEYYYDGMGHYYAVPLANVTGKGLQGWFDLKIRLEDAAGNWQEQIISPAFRIDDQAYSSVATVGSGNAHEVARYNLAGQRVDASTPGVAIIKMSDGTARKVIQ